MSSVNSDKPLESLEFFPGCARLCAMTSPLFRLSALFAALILLAPLLHGQVGFAQGVTGGAGGREVTAHSPEELKNYAGSEVPLIINIQGKLRIGTIAVGSNKTLQGQGDEPTLHGALHLGGNAQNVIIRDLNITNPTKKKNTEGFDGITVRGGKRVWITQCTFTDCGDGMVDISRGADDVTVSYCKFQYSDPDMQHRFVMLISGPEKKGQRQLKVTLHHNWFGENCGSRMPAVRGAEVHMFNNFFDCEGNDYATNARKRAEILSENNFYQNVKNPFYAEDGGDLREKGNIYKICSGRLEDGDDDVFKPKYPYTLDKTKSVPDIVRAKAGA